VVNNKSAALRNRKNLIKALSDNPETDFTFSYKLEWLMPIAREKDLTGPTDTPSLRTVVEMAKWRKSQINWRDRTELAVETLHLSATPPPTPNPGRKNNP